MEILNGKSAFLSNYEVLQLLKERQPSFSAPEMRNSYLVASDTIKYLEKSACKNQSPEMFRNLLQGLNKYDLTKTEKLQILNQMPQTAVEIQLIVEECEERMSVEEIDELIEIISKHS